MAFSVVAGFGNSSYAATGSGINLGYLTLQAGDIVAGHIKWEGTTVTPVLAFQGANSGATFTISSPVKHATQNIWYADFRSSPLAASGSPEQLILFLDPSPGAGRPSYGARGLQLRDLPGTWSFLARSNSASIDAPASGNTTLAAAGALACGPAGGILISAMMSDEDWGGFTLASGYTANPDGVTGNFVRSQYKVLSGAGSEQPGATLTGVQANAAHWTMMIGGATTSDPVVDVTNAVEQAGDVVVSGTYSSTGSTSISVTLTHSDTSQRGPVSATLANGAWTARFTAPGVGTYSTSASVTDTVGSGSDTGPSVTVAPASLARPTIASQGGPSPATVSGTGLPGCAVDLLVDGVTVVPAVATVAANGRWSVQQALSVGTRRLRARQNQTVALQEGQPPDPTVIEVTELSSPQRLRLSTTDPGQPHTAYNWFRYPDANSADSDGVLVGSSTGPSIEIPSPVPGWYSVGCENVVPGASGSPWYSNKVFPRKQWGTVTAPSEPVILENDIRRLFWITPNRPIAQSVTDGRYQMDRTGYFRQLPTDSAGVSGATHSAEGVAWPLGGSGDAAWLFRRTQVGGIWYFHHQIGLNVPIDLGNGQGNTWRAEYNQSETKINRGQRWIMATIMRFDPSFLSSGGPFCSLADLHHEQNRYGGPGPIGIWGNRGGIEVYYRLGVGGSWQFQRQLMSWVPEASRDYLIIIDALQHFQAGNGAFIDLYFAVDSGPLTKFSYVGPWGIDGSPDTMYWKTGLYAFDAPGAGPYSRKSRGLIGFNQPASNLILPGQMAATMRSLA